MGHMTLVTPTRLTLDIFSLHTKFSELVSAVLGIRSRASKLRMGHVTLTMLLLRVS